MSASNVTRRLRSILRDQNASCCLSTISIRLMILASLPSRQLQSVAKWICAMNVIGRCLLVGYLIARALLQSSSVSAANWPERVVKFVLPGGAGSSIDVAARLFAEGLSERW